MRKKISRGGRDKARGDSGQIKAAGLSETRQDVESSAGAQEGNSASMGDNASEPRAGAGTWGPEYRTSGELPPWNVNGSGLSGSVLGSMVQWTEPGGGWTLQISVLALPPSSCATLGKSLLLWASMSYSFS